jgi:tetratricopeptide (TPR) repeat protein
MEGEREASIVEAKAAVRLAPDYAEAQALLGILLRHAGRNAEAIEALQAAWRLSPPSVAAGLELAAWELNHDRPEEAERILEVCQIYQPGDSRVLLLQAEALERAGKLVQAEKAWRALVDRGVGGADALRHLSDINDALGNQSLAKSFREQAKQINPFELASQPRRRTVRARPYSDQMREFPTINHQYQTP